MLRILFSCLMLICRVESNWEAEDSDPSDANLGFSLINMTCNDAMDLCQHNYIASVHSREVLAVFEYTKDPYKFQVSVREGKQSKDWSFFQDDLDGKYRWCESVDSKASWEFDYSRRYTACFENSFDDISIPEGCAKPLAVVTYDTHLYDDKVRGQQMLLCLP
ncbi:uncharacterized protein LOC119723169 [Patiria miniata]|uniref:Uncharacterized protein n=1 Tax=Patiria miniata TaxID=46514 RepID=A0A913ZFB3_PATMI|nr:uncharacterized protein LOC119723169 [Patiria miniata]